MMLSEFFSFIAKLLQIDGSILMVLAPFALIGFVLWKILQIFVLRGNSVILSIAGIFFLGLAQVYWNERAILGMLGVTFVLVFIGHEMYQRLIRF